MSTTTTPTTGQPAEPPPGRLTGSPAQGLDERHAAEPASPDADRADRQAQAVALQLAVAGWAVTRSRQPASHHPPEPAGLCEPAGLARRPQPPTAHPTR